MLFVTIHNTISLSGGAIGFLFYISCISILVTTNKKISRNRFISRFTPRFTCRFTMLVFFPIYKAKCRFTCRFTNRFTLRFTEFNHSFALQPHDEAVSLRLAPVPSVSKPLVRCFYHTASPGKHEQISPCLPFCEWLREPQFAVSQASMKFYPTKVFSHTTNAPLLRSTEFRESTLLCCHCW